MRPTLGACRVRSLISGLGIVWRTAQALRELPFHLEAGGGRVRGRTALAGVGGGISRSSRSHVQSPMLSVAAKVGERMGVGKSNWPFMRGINFFRMQVKVSEIEKTIFKILFYCSKFFFFHHLSPSQDSRQSNIG
ncbi:uncharacterized protein ACOB8E_023954 [Sarcophilus harrisii]